MYAAFSGREDTVEYVLQKGADVSKRGILSVRDERLSRIYNYSAIDLANVEGHNRIIRLLEKVNADTAREPEVLSPLKELLRPELLDIEVARNPGE